MLNRLNRLLNPFETVRYESTIKPDSRTLHTSFFEKMNDTFQVICGGTRASNLFSDDEKFTFKPFDPNTPPGLIDYATLGTFRLIHLIDTQLIRVMNMEADDAKGLKKAGIYTAQAFSALPFAIFRVANIVANDIIRHAASAILTLVVSPIVLLSHGISKAVGRFLAWKAANEIEVDRLCSGYIETPFLPTGGGVLTQKAKLNEALGETSLLDALVRPHPSTKKDTDRLQFGVPLNKKNLSAGYRFAAMGIFAKDSKERLKLIEVSKHTRLNLLSPEECKPRYRG